MNFLANQKISHNGKAIEEKHVKYKDFYSPQRFDGLNPWPLDSLLILTCKSLYLTTFGIKFEEEI